MMIFIGGLFMAAFITGLFAPVVDSKDRFEARWNEIISDPKTYAKEEA